MCDTVRVRTAYRCRAYPDQAQQAGAGAHVRLRPRRVEPDPGRAPARCHTEGKGTSYAETDAALTAMKREPDLAFLSEVS